MAGQWAIRASVRSGAAGRVERVAEQDERGDTARPARPRPGSPPGRRTSGRRPRRRRSAGTDEVERRQRVLGLALGQVDGRRVDATSAQALDERGHAGRRPARAVAQEAAQRSSRQGSRPMARSAGRVMARSGHGRPGPRAAILGADTHRRAHAATPRSDLDRRAASRATDPRRAACHGRASSLLGGIGWWRRGPALAADADAHACGSERSTPTPPIPDLIRPRRRP